MFPVSMKQCFIVVFRSVLGYFFGFVLSVCVVSGLARKCLVVVLCKCNAGKKYCQL